MEEISKLNDENLEKLVNKEIILRSTSTIRDKTTFGIISDLYFRIDRSFSDNFIKNILLSVKNEKANGIVINSEDQDEGRLMVMRVRLLAKKILKGNIHNYHTNSFLEEQN